MSRDDTPAKAILIRTQIAATSLDCRFLALLLQAETAKEYDANWLKNAKSVRRDGAGRFAKKGAAQSSFKPPAESGEPVKPKRKANPLLLSSASKSLDAAIAEQPGLLERTTKRMFGAKAAKSYTKPSQLNSAFEAAVEKYNMLLEDLSRVKEGSSDRLQALGQLSAPIQRIGVYLNAAIGSVAAIEVLSDGGPASILDGYGAGKIAEAAAKQAEKAKDDKRAKLKKEVIRDGLAVVLAVAAGIALHQGLHAFKLGKAAKIADQPVEQSIAALEREAETQISKGQSWAKANSSPESLPVESKPVKPRDVPTLKPLAKKAVDAQAESLKNGILDDVIRVGIEKRRIPDYSSEGLKEMSRQSQLAEREYIDRLLSKHGLYQKAEEQAMRDVEFAMGFGATAAEDLEKAASSGYRAGLESALSDLFADAKISLHDKSRLIFYSLDTAKGEWLPTKIPKTKAVDDSMFRFEDAAFVGKNPGFHIRQYTGGEDVDQEVNKALRNGGPISPETTKKINGIRHDLSRLPRAKPHEPMARFLRMENADEWVSGLKEGEDYIDLGFQSFSPVSFGTGEFSDNSAHKIKFLMHPSEESIARDITHWNGSGEYEALYPPGVKFKVVRKSKESFPSGNSERPDGMDDRWTIELEEVEQKGSVQ